MIRCSLKSNLFLLLNILFVCLIISLKSYADDQKKLGDLVVLGPNNAPVKIKIFSSLTCPHCAYFHINVIPKIKKNYVESGKVQLIFIDFPLDQSAFDASKLLHCLDKKEQIKFLDIIYKNQGKWTTGSNTNEINENLKKIVKNLGITSVQFDKCINNEVVSDKILNGRIAAHQKYSVNSTPTIIINEKKFKGSASFEGIKKKIEKLI
jgi:protein-disulfide isomerase